MKKAKPQLPTYFLLCLLLAIGLHFVLPIMQLIHAPYKYGGGLLIGIGFWLNVWADSLFKKKDTTVESFRI